MRWPNSTIITHDRIVLDLFEGTANTSSYCPTADNTGTTTTGTDEKIIPAKIIKPRRSSVVAMQSAHRRPTVGPIVQMKNQIYTHYVKLEMSTNPKVTRYYHVLSTRHRGSDVPDN